MKEEVKEWLGIKPADFVIYTAFLLMVPVYFSRNQFVDAACISIGLLLCFASCWLGMKPHPELSRLNNAVKLLAYPACTLLFLYLGYKNYAYWQ